MHNFWSVEFTESSMIISPELSFPILVKKFTPRYFFEIIDILNNYYMKKFNIDYEFKYSIQFNHVKKNELILDYHNFRNAVGLYGEDNIDEGIVNCIIEGYSALERLSGQIEEKFNSYQIIFPIIEIRAYFIEKKNHTLLYKLAKDKKINIKLITKRLSELFDMLYELNESGYIIEKLPLDRVITTSLDHKHRQGNLICFIPEYLRYTNRNDSFIKSIPAVVEYMRSFLKHLKNGNSDLLFKTISGLVGRLQSHNHLGDFQQYIRFLENKTGKKKIEIIGYVDWPNVNKALFNNSIDWNAMLNFLREEILKDLSSRNLSFSSVEYSHLYFIKYKPNNYSSTYFKEINDEEDEKLSKIVIQLKESATVEYVSGETEKEFQAVDKEILERINILFEQGNNPDILILFTSDGDYLSGYVEDNFNTIDHYLAIGIPIYIISFGTPSKLYSESKQRFPELLRIITLNNLLKFIKESK